MKNPRVILASTSPRRRELLGGLGLAIEVREPRCAEVPEPGEEVGAMVVRFAREKARSVQDSVPAGSTIVAADTVVCVDDRIIGKPRDDDDAREILRELSGRWHEVITGYHVCRDHKHREGTVISRIAFRELNETEIAAYVATGEPGDKAGAYGIQGQGGALVDRVEGSYTNVVGLPIAEVLAALDFLGR